LPGNALLRDPFDEHNPLTPKTSEIVQDETRQAGNGVKDTVVFLSLYHDRLLKHASVLVMLTLCVLLLFACEESDGCAEVGKFSILISPFTGSFLHSD
jgi:hypothetical protein